ncbi:uncharacterized protein LOC108148247 [Drosophila elegans]|uniref:uncharacterized protein LOC108148247 n=1 Tax=Drosophila elegans TaxID=30023 RepID=UPI001BC84B50|nr:uncharacterized protein LOC108148247 [Drosophila elegans]
MSENQEQGAGLVPPCVDWDNNEDAASESSEHESTASVDDRPVCAICGTPFDGPMEMDHVRTRNTAPSGPADESVNHTPSDHQQSVGINVSIAIAPAGGPPVTIGFTGGEAISSQTPASFILTNRHPTNVFVQIQPNGLTAAQGQSTSCSEVFISESVVRCPICLLLATNPRATSCGHVFCELCLQRALEYRKICPTCGVPQEYINSLQIFP